MISRLVGLARRAREDRSAIMKAVTKRAYEFLERFGLHLVPDHFYYPIPSSRNFHQTEPWNDDFSVEGIEIREGDQLV